MPHPPHMNTKQNIGKSDLGKKKKKTSINLEELIYKIIWLFRWIEKEDAVLYEKETCPIRTFCAIFTLKKTLASSIMRQLPSEDNIG